MNETEYPRFTECMATGHSIGHFGWVIPSILFQANIATAGRVKNKHNLSQYSFEGVIIPQTCARRMQVLPRNRRPQAKALTPILVMNVTLAA